MKKAISVLTAACVLVGLLCAGAVPAGAEGGETVDAVLESIGEEAIPGEISASGVGGDIGRHALTGLWVIAAPFLAFYAIYDFFTGDPEEENWGIMAIFAIPLLPLVIPIFAVAGLLQVLISPITGILQSVGWISKPPLGVPPVRD